MQAPEHIKQQTGKEWETVKSLKHVFAPQALHRVLLVDADGFKVGLQPACEILFSLCRPLWCPIARCLDHAATWLVNA